MKIWQKVWPWSEIYGLIDLLSESDGRAAHYRDAMLDAAARLDAIKAMRSDRTKRGNATKARNRKALQDQTTQRLKEGW